MFNKTVFRYFVLNFIFLLVPSYTYVLPLKEHTQTKLRLNNYSLGPNDIETNILKISNKKGEIRAEVPEFSSEVSSFVGLGNGHGKIGGPKFLNTVIDPNNNNEQGFITETNLNQIEGVALTPPNNDENGKMSFHEVLKLLAMWNLSNDFNEYKVNNEYSFVDSNNLNTEQSSLSIPEGNAFNFEQDRFINSEVFRPKSSSKTPQN